MRGPPHPQATIQSPPLPPFTHETAIQKVRLAEDAWNARAPEKVEGAHPQLFRVQA
jgi:nuclear transport factor 2 (NTF2) superfamily protein